MMITPSASPNHHSAHAMADIGGRPPSSRTAARTAAVSGPLMTSGTTISANSPSTESSRCTRGFNRRKRAAVRTATPTLATV